MTRYLVRLPNRKGLTPNEIVKVSERVRGLLGSREKASHFRIGSKAIEFNLFADTDAELDTYKEILEKEFSRLLLVKPLPIMETFDKDGALIEGIGLFNQERFWESQEILEQAWNQSTGPEKDVIQGLILTGAAFVHEQKGEDDVCLSILSRARKKLDAAESLNGKDLHNLKANIDHILESKRIMPFPLLNLKD